MKEGVMIIGHGSKMRSNKDVMEIHAERLRKKGFENVYIGFNEISSPSIDETLKIMANDGIDIIFALPLFIAPGRHTTVDIPEKLGLSEEWDNIIRVDGRWMKVNYATPIGDDPYITDILIGKINSIRGAGTNSL